MPINSSAYISDHSDLQVACGQFHLHAFGALEVRCLSLMVTTLEHYTIDG
jgi:hypothetical protein